MKSPMMEEYLVSSAIKRLHRDMINTDIKDVIYLKKVR